MERKFEIKLECVSKETISVRLFSTHKVDLMLKSVKAYYQPENADEWKGGILPVWLDNSAKIQTFSFPKASDSYTSLNFIIKDKTNKLQYAVRIPLNGEKIEYRVMTYEGV